MPSADYVHDVPMRPTRTVPKIGQKAVVVDLGATTPAQVVAVDGASLTVRTDAGTELVFELHATTGHWVKRGDPYWGTRLRLGEGW
jgi:hypothetical protein